MQRTAPITWWARAYPSGTRTKPPATLVAQCIDRGLTLETLPLEDYRAVCDLFDQEVYHKINLDTCVATRISEGGPCPESVERQIGKVQAFLDKYPL